ncbi:MAG: ATP synthase F1 subunit gamma, partial [Candidatus Nomurabacteria bacterium]|nr:ATP synthase F1 subunit gamma [Candidatus Nomurabacteria bacterium]
TSLSGKLDEISHPFFIEKKEGKTLIVLITSNRGLCGGYNSQVTKKTVAMLKSLVNEDKQEVDFITIGKKGDASLRRIAQNITASFTELPDNISLSDVNSISHLLTSEYELGYYKNVYVAYTDFVSALTQKPHIRKLLPVSKIELKEVIENLDNEKIVESKNTNTETYLLEGNADQLIKSLAEKLVKMQIYQMLLESNASEQSSRMLSMKNAGDAAGEMISDLTLVFNKARQANITREISEISAGMASVS